MGAFLGRIKGWRLKTDLQVRGNSDVIQRRQGGLQAGNRIGKSCWVWLSPVPLKWLHFHKSVLQVLQAWKKEGTEKLSSLLQITQHVRDSRESSLGFWASGSVHATQELCCLATHWCSRKVRIQDLHTSQHWCSSWRPVAIIYYFFYLWVSMYVVCRHVCISVCVNECTCIIFQNSVSTIWNEAGSLAEPGTYDSTSLDKQLAPWILSQPPQVLELHVGCLVFTWMLGFWTPDLIPVCQTHQTTFWPSVTISWMNN